MEFGGENLTCIRGDRMVFSGLNFALSRGGALMLRGPNGSGKSSLLRLCAGLLKPAEGRLVFGGAAVEEDAEAHRARIQYVGHLDPLKPVFTVAENLRFAAALRGQPSDIEAALACFGLAGLADLPACYLSAGQRRRVNLARLAATPAPLWLLDEPSTALDAAAQDALIRLVAEHRARGGMAMVATHVDFEAPGAEVLRLGRPTAAPEEAGA